VKKRHSTLLDKPVLFKNPNYGHSMVIYDIEVSYIVSATWDVYETNVVKILREPFIIGIGWKFLDSKETFYKDITDFPLYKRDRFNDKALIEYFKDNVIERAEIFIGHNSNSFDWKWIMGRYVTHDIEPPSTKRHVDTYRVCKNLFKFPYYSLKYLAEKFNLPRKKQNDGIDLWVDCIENNIPTRWQEMEDYCKCDVIATEALYLHIRPFVKNHPNMNMLLEGMTLEKGKSMNCPKCGDDHIVKLGFAYTNTATYQTYLCRNCGARPKGEKVDRPRPFYT
jgi:DNA polymerase elongation subunit (family B)